jgi:hypothetical protein
VRFRRQRNVPEGVGGSVRVAGEELCDSRLSVARGATAALWTGMKFLNDSAQVRIGLSSIVRVDVVHNLVAVVVHLNFAMRANHFVSVSHNGHPLSPAISQDLCDASVC